jgi:Rad52/22 family double-strand break repair protein
VTDTQAERPVTPEQMAIAVFHGALTAEQHDFLLTNLNANRVATRQQGGKTLSYLEAWDVRAHLVRVFGFGNFDSEVLAAEHVFTRDYMSGGDNPHPMQEIAYKVVLRLVIRDETGLEVARYTEAAVGSASGGSNFGDLHDNAVKQAASDALKRCAINLGTQFGLSLYNNGSRQEIVRVSLVRPEGALRGAPPKPGGDLKPEQAQVLVDSLGAQVVSDTATETPPEQGSEDKPQFGNTANTTDEVDAGIAKAQEATKS